MQTAQHPALDETNSPAEWIILPMITATTFAATALISEEVDIVRPVLDALASGQPVLAMSLLLVVAAAFARRYGGPRWPALNTELGSAALVLIGSFGGAAAAAISGGSEPGLALAWHALKVAIGASGGYSLVKQLIVDPLLRPLAARSPNWLQPIFGVVFWAFDHGSGVSMKAGVIDAAEAAGDAAVKAMPASGITTITGEPRRVD